MNDNKDDITEDIDPEKVWANGAELHEEWDDGVTVAIRYFSSYEEAEEYAISHKIASYNIYPRL